MKEMEIAPILARAILREQTGGKYDICFQDKRISDIPFGMFFKQGGNKSPSLFNLMMRGIFKKNIARKVAEKGVGSVALVLRTTVASLRSRKSRFSRFH